jgi:hypothetical protein
MKLVVFLFSLFLRVHLIEIDSFKLNIEPVSFPSWIAENKLIINEENKAYIYNVESREKEKEFKKESNQLLGYKDNKYIICEWEHRIINSLEEYSTHFIQKLDNGEIIKDLEFKPTLEVVECKENIIFKTIYPLEEKFYLFDQELFEIEEYTSRSTSSNLKYWISIDDFNNYWINKITLF